MIEVPTCSMVMLDGSQVEMTLNFGRLLKLRQTEKYKSLYKRFNKIRLEGVEDELDRVTVLYAGYLCANINNLDECMDEEDFFYLTDPNRVILDKNFYALMLPKAPAATAKPSEAKQEEPAAE